MREWRGEQQQQQRGREPGGKWQVVRKGQGRRFSRRGEWEHRGEAAADDTEGGWRGGDVGRRWGRSREAEHHQQEAAGGQQPREWWVVGRAAALRPPSEEDLRGLMATMPDGDPLTGLVAALFPAAVSEIRRVGRSGGGGGGRRGMTERDWRGMSWPVLRKGRGDVG